MAPLPGGFPAAPGSYLGGSGFLAAAPGDFQESVRAARAGRSAFQMADCCFPVSRSGVAARAFVQDGFQAALPGYCQAGSPVADFRRSLGGSLAGLDAPLHWAALQDGCYPDDCLALLGAEPLDCSRGGYRSGDCRSGDSCHSDGFHSVGSQLPGAARLDGYPVLRSDGFPDHSGDFRLVWRSGDSPDGFLEDLLDDRVHYSLRSDELYLLLHAPMAEPELVVQP